MRYRRYYKKEQLDLDFVTGVTFTNELYDKNLQVNILGSRKYANLNPTVVYNNTNKTYQLSGMSTGALGWFDNSLRYLTSGSSNLLNVSGLSSFPQTLTFFLVPTTGQLSSGVRVLNSSTGTTYTFRRSPLQKYEGYYVSGVTGNIAPTSPNVKLINLTLTSSTGTYTTGNLISPNIQAYPTGYFWFKSGGQWSTTTGALQTTINAQFTNVSDKIAYVTGQLQTTSGFKDTFVFRNYSFTKKIDTETIASSATNGYQVTFATGAGDVLLAASGITGNYLLMLTFQFEIDQADIGASSHSRAKPDLSFSVNGGGSTTVLSSTDCRYYHGSAGNTPNGVTAPFSFSNVRVQTNATIINNIQAQLNINNAGSGSITLKNILLTMQVIGFGP